MSVLDRLTSLIPQVSSPPRQVKKSPSVSLSPSLSLSSPVIKKKPIQITSFDEKGLSSEKHSLKQTNTGRDFFPSCLSKTSSRPSWSKSSQDSQWIPREGASTLPRTKPKSCSSPSLSAKPRISIFPVQKPNSSPTHCTLKPKPSPSLHLPDSDFTDPSPLLHLPLPQPPAASTLTIPAPRLSPSPTSSCREITLEGPEFKQPSPIAKDRGVRSISISNTKGDSSSCRASSTEETRRDLLDQDGAKTDWSRPALRKLEPMKFKESPRQRHSDSQRQASETSFSSQGKNASAKCEKNDSDKPRLPPRNTDISAILRPSLSIKRQQECLPSDATGKQTFLSKSGGIMFSNVAQRKSLQPFDTLPIHSGLNLHSECEDGSRDGTGGLGSNEQPYEPTCAGKSPALPPPPPPSPRVPADSVSKQSSENHSAVVHNTDTRRSQHSFSSNAKVVTPLHPLGSYLQGSLGERTSDTSSEASAHNIAAPQESRSWRKAPSANPQTDTGGAPRSSGDYSCHSREDDEGKVDPRRTRRLNKLNTCLVAPHTWRADWPTPSKRAAEAAEQPWAGVQHHGLYGGRTGWSCCHEGLNRTAGPPSTQSSETYVGRGPPPATEWPFNTPSSRRVSDGLLQPLHRVKRVPAEPPVGTSPPLHRQPNHPPAAAAAFMTEEDPYYVTMYYPGSVYVDMSDVVPPEVRPKPVVPAKPPNVGAPSPSNPFPTQGPGIGIGGGVPPLPPSGIPVPIGSHGPMHVGSHSVAHSVTHGVGHGVSHTGGHTAAHNGGHGVSHGSGGGSTLLGYIGIDTIIEQMRKKTMKTGFDFNIMVVGNSGLGKSTMVNTLFKSQVSRRSAGWSRDEKIPKTVEVKAVSHVLEEGGVKMKLTVIDTPGFGDQINNDNCWEPIFKYINEQYEKFLKEEVNITRKKRIPDTRVHCCLYFISPTGHSLRQLDVEFMKRLSHSVNIIPIIAKADTMTIEERQEFKQRVRKELEMSGIEFYPQKEFDEDMEDKSDNDKIRETMPFAVVGSDKEYQVNGKRILGRKTPWGIVEVENSNHCEFAQLRDFLIRSHLQDLKEVTHNIHYETYRAKRLNENGGLHPISCTETQESNL